MEERSFASSNEIFEEANSLFKKKFTFNPGEDWRLPSVDTVNKEKIWNLDVLQNFKHGLNSVKSRLNDKGEDWQKHTANMNKAGLVLDRVRKVVKPEFLTQAWCKFYEILASFPIVASDGEPFRSFHLCEAPGAFISALNYYLCLNHGKLAWEWYANTLNPYYEGYSVRNVVVDDRLLFHTLKNWHFGDSNTGDVLLPSYLHDVVKFFNSLGPVHLVTADGSVNCLENPGEQELMVADLQLSEIMIALHVLAPGGTFVVKKFTLFECISVCTMYLLNCLFDKVHVFKPATSKSGNSEVYVIGLGYKGSKIILSYTMLFQEQLCSKEFALFPQESISLDFLHQLEECCHLFMNYQISSIEQNIKFYDSMTHEKQSYLDEIKLLCADMYIQKYCVESLHPNSYCRLYARKKKNIKTAYGDVHQSLKFDYHKALGCTFENISNYKLMPCEQRLLDLESRMNICFPLQKKRHLTFSYWYPVWKEIFKHVKYNCCEEWVRTGKRFDCVQNSKFCNPLLLLLWNEAIANNPKIVPETHQVKSHSHWDWDSFASIVHECPEISQCEVVLNVELNGLHSSCVSTGLISALDNGSEIKNCILDDICNEKYSGLHKIVVIDSSSWWTGSFHLEIQVKCNFVKFMSSMITNLKSGDCVILCFPSLLTRFMVGIVYLFLSMFTKTTTILPLDTAPALTGQIWVLVNFQTPPWTKSLHDYLEYILNFQTKEKNAVLEVVPIPVLCGGQFYEYLLNINYSFMLQRLQKLISVEKIHLKCEK